MSKHVNRNYILKLDFTSVNPFHRPYPLKFPMHSQMTLHDPLAIKLEDDSEHA